MSTPLHFGMPWHGTFSPAGLTLPNGTLRTEWPGGPGQEDTHYVKFGMPDPPAASAADTAAGRTWKNDIILSGTQKNYAPGGLGIGSQSWVYRTPDGTIFTATIASAYQIVIMHNPSGVYNVQSITTPADTLIEGLIVNQSPDGTRAIANFKSNTIPQERIFVEFTLAGGGWGVSPTMSFELLERYTANNVTYPQFQRMPLLAGYDKTGSRQIISGYTSQNVVGVVVGPAVSPYEWEIISDTYYTSSVHINNAPVWTGPVWHAHVHYLAPYAGYPGGISIISQYQENPDWHSTALNSQIISNCMVGVGYGAHPTLVFDTLVSLYGVVDGAEIVGTLMSLNPKGAYNQRADAVAFGAGVGFI